MRRVLLDIDGIRWAARIRILAHYLARFAEELERLEVEYDEHDSEGETL